MHFVSVGVIAFVPSLTAWERIGRSGWTELERRNIRLNRLYCFLFVLERMTTRVDSPFLSFFYQWIDDETLGK